MPVLDPQLVKIKDNSSCFCIFAEKCSSRVKNCRQLIEVEKDRQSLEENGRLWRERGVWEHYVKTNQVRNPFPKRKAVPGVILISKSETKDNKADVTRDSSPSTQFQLPELSLLVTSSLFTTIYSPSPSFSSHSTELAHPERGIRSEGQLSHLIHR